jgi:hypothetical protein
MGQGIRRTGHGGLPVPAKLVRFCNPARLAARDCAGGHLSSDVGRMEAETRHGARAPGRVAASGTRSRVPGGGGRHRFPDDNHRLSTVVPDIGPHEEKHLKRRRCFVCNAVGLCVHREAMLLPKKVTDSLFPKGFNTFSTLAEAESIYRLQVKKCRSAFAYAMRIGRLVRPLRCQDCDEYAATEGHHTDYTRPLDVRWLCDRCHGVADTHMGSRRKIAVFNLLMCVENPDSEEACTPDTTRKSRSIKNYSTGASRREKAS